ncbi:MAG: MarR family transcriptional regulator [Clostridia bacterium]|nr:MarR family transcriptional regulator [Clostridia bacterium]
MNKKRSKCTKNEEYLAKVFEIMKRRDDFSLVAEEVPFNSTELRMLSEIVVAKKDGSRLISTQLAKRIGVTRSAVSQIVNRLEARGVVKRVPDAVDKKIAYIEIAPEIENTCGETLKQATSLIGKIVQRFGAEKLDTMCALFDEFVATAQQVCAECQK